MGLSKEGEVDMSATSETGKTQSEAAFEVEGGSGTTKSQQESQKKGQASTTKRVTEDGWEEEVYEEYEEECTTTSTTTTISSTGAAPTMEMIKQGMGAAVGSETTEVTSAQMDVKAKDGIVLDMQQSSDKKKETKEMIIPIQIQGQPAIQQKPKTPRPRMLPFQFPSMPALPMPPMSMPAMPSSNMDPFDMRMPSASDMMAQMQMEMSQSMASMQMQSMHQMESMQSSCMQQVEQMQMQQMSQMQQSSQQSFQQQHQELQNFQLNEPGHEQTVEVSELDDQDFFVPLRHIEKVQKNALSEATAMAKMRDGIFELVINIQGFEPEDVQIFCVDQEQAVYVKAKHVTEEGFVNNVYEQKFSLPDDVDTQKLTSGMSRDGILMIRVPRAVSPERIIPIKREVKMEAVKKA